MNVKKKKKKVLDQREKNLRAIASKSEREASAHAY